MADNKIRAPNMMDFSKAAENWPKWLQKLEIYLLAAGYTEKDDKSKIAIMLNLMGDEGINIFNTFSLKVEEAKFKDVIKIFEKHCVPKRNLTIESYKFNKLSQKVDQPIESFIIELKSQADLCEFKCSWSKDYTDRMVKDRLVVGVFDTGLQQALLKEKDTDLGKIIDICKTSELSKKYSKLLNETVDDDVSVDVINHKRFNNNKNKCKNCGFSHQDNGYCYANGKHCVKCGKLGHFGNVCRTINKFQQSSNYQQNSSRFVRGNNSRGGWNRGFKRGNTNTTNNIHEVYPDQAIDGTLDRHSAGDSHLNLDSRHFIGQLECGDNIQLDKNWYQDVEVSNMIVKFKLDTGAEINVLPFNMFRTLKINNSVPIRSTKITLLTYGNFKIIPIGIVSLQCGIKNNGLKRELDFVVVREELQPLLGLKSCILLNLIKRINEVINLPTCKAMLIKMFDSFEGQGLIKGFVHKIRIKDNAIPVDKYRKRVPFSLQT